VAAGQIQNSHDSATRERDRLIPQEQADLLVSAAKRGKKVVIAGGSHAPYMSDRETWHHVLLEFLGELK
jgi:pimeloyl-ACP methyl ester carboxylesterase